MITLFIKALIDHTLTAKMDENYWRDLENECWSPREQFQAYGNFKSSEENITDLRRQKETWMSIGRSWQKLCRDHLAYEKLNYYERKCVIAAIKNGRKTPYNGQQLKEEEQLKLAFNVDYLISFILAQKVVKGENLASSPQWPIPFARLILKR